MSCVLTVRDIGGVFIDVVVSEDATASMEIPQHPVEKGAKISDHAFRQPTTLKMTCANGGDPVASFNALMDVMKRSEPFDVITGFGLFQNMLIESINPTRDVTTGQILAFDASLKEVIIVESQTGGASKNGGDERGAGKTERGEVQAKAVDTGPGTKGETVLNNLLAAN